MQIRRTTSVIGTGLLLATGLSACGSDVHKQRPTGSRPPAKIDLSAVIQKKEISIAPRKVGGGPMSIVVSNQSGKTVTAILTDAASGSTVAKSAYPIVNGQSAVLSVIAEANTNYSLGTDTDSDADSAVKAATLKVTAMRKSSDDELLLP